MTTRKTMIDRLDTWKVPLVFAAAMAAAIAAFGNIRQAAYESMVEPCVEKTVDRMMSPWVGATKELTKAVRYNTTVLIMSMPADSLNKINDMYNKMWKGVE